MAADAILNLGKYAFAICQLRSMADSQDIPHTKFGEDWSNSEEMATVFQNTRWRRQPS